MSLPLSFRMAKVGHILGKAGMRGLTAVEKAVLNALSDEHGHIGQFADLSLKEIVYRTRFSRASVQRALRTLRNDDAVIPDRTENQGSGQITRYHIRPEKFYIVKSAQEGPHSDALKGITVSRKGLTVMPPSLYAPYAPNTAPQAEALNPSSNEVEAGTSDRPDKAKPDGRKKPRRNAEEIEAIEGLLMSRLKQVDPLLAPGIVSDCRKVNPEITTEQMLFLLTQLFLKSIPDSIRNQKGWIRERMKQSARASYVAALNERAERDLREIMRKSR